MNEQEQQLSGPDVLVARVYGDDIPGLKMAALDQARDLYGPDAALRVEHVDRINTALADKGKFWTYVHVRCLNLPAEDR
jgi:hypothetical protein